jgi:hypothetical protein
MAVAYQAVVMVSTGIATMARTRLPERAALAQAKVDENMRVREPHGPEFVNAIKRLLVEPIVVSLGAARPRK